MRPATKEAVDMAVTVLLAVAFFLLAVGVFELAQKFP